MSMKYIWDRKNIKDSTGGRMKTPPRKCPLCGIDMESCDYSPLYGYSWLHPKTENDCKHGTLLFGGHKLEEGCSDDISRD